MNEAKERTIINDYLSGMSMAKVGIKNTIYPSTVMRVLQKHGVPSRNLSQARRMACDFKLNEHVFETIDNQDKSYWLGVMYSDGFISKSNKYTNYFGISVKESDREWLEKFQEFLETNREIKTYAVTQGYKVGTRYVRLSIGNNKIVSDLEKHGVMEHKSLKNAFIPDIPYPNDFIRGYIDGNGSIHRKNGSIVISGNIFLLADIQQILRIEGRFYQDKSIYGLHFKPIDSRKICNRLYKNAHYYLDRKYQLASKYFE